MPIPDYDTYRERLASPRSRLTSYKGNNSAANQRPMSPWMLSLHPAPAPTVPVAPTIQTLGALGTFVENQPSILNGNTERLLFCGTNLNSGTATRNGTFLFCDRLSHQGGIDATNITPNLTTNLPTAPLTRYTDGKGVLMAVDIYVQIGATAATLSLNYTNQAGVSGKQSPAIGFGGGNQREVWRRFLVPFAPGDTGVRSVESVTLSATTGTAGNYGVVLYKPLAMVPMPSGDQAMSELLFLIGNMPEVHPQACLEMVQWWVGTSNPFSTHDIALAED